MTNLELIRNEVEVECRSLEGCGLGLVRTFKTGPKSSVTGTVVDTKFSRTKIVGDSVKGVFKITLECGPRKIRRDFDSYKI